MGPTEQPPPRKPQEDRAGGVEKPVAVKKFMDAFPKKIPGATTIEHYPTEGATHCLVHIHQTHHTGTLEEELAALKASSDIPKHLKKDLEKDIRKRRAETDREVKM